MQIGDTVYTVNNKTKKVDPWKYAGTLRTPDALLVHLTDGPRYVYLPANCVYFSELEALAISEKYK